MNDPDPVTALVVFRSASGRPVHGGDAITTETLADVLPDPHDVESVATHFRDLGFTTGPPLGISMSITAPRAHVEKVFGVELSLGSDGAWTLAGSDGPHPAGDGGSAGDVELPVAALPDAVVRQVSSIVIEPPVELFGELTP